MMYLISSCFFGLLFSVLCGACAATLLVALKVSGAVPIGIAVGVLVFALYVVLTVSKQKKLLQSVPAFEEKEALCVELYAHLFAKSYRGSYKLYVFSDNLYFFSPTAPSSLKTFSFKKEDLAIAKVLISPEEEDVEVYDLVLYEGKEQIAQLHTRARYRTALEQTLASLGYFDAPLPQMVETN